MSDTGMNQARLAHLRATIEEDILRGRYFGCVLMVARGGRIALREAIGTADAQRARPLALDSVFSIFSVTKAITNVLALRAMELGQFDLTTRVAEVIPEFSGGLRETITVHHLMTHTSGLPMLYSPKPNMYIDVLAEVIAAICEVAHSVEPPGERVAYSPICNHALLGEILRRTDPAGRCYRDIVTQDLLEPLGMRDSSIGLRRDLKARHVVPDFRGNFPIQHPGHSNLGPNGAFEEEHAEMPWVGMAATVPDMFRFAEMLRCKGTLDGARILSPASLALACRNLTGDKPNELYKALYHKRGWEPCPAYLGLGFALRGSAVCHHLYGTLASPETFGNYGAGSALYWVDPVRDVSFVFLSAGVMEGTSNIERCQRLSDIVHSAVE